MSDESLPSAAKCSSKADCSGPNCDCFSPVPASVEELKQQLVDETGAAMWERWYPILDNLIQAVQHPLQQEIDRLTLLLRMRTLAAEGYDDARKEADTQRERAEQAEAEIARLHAEKG